MATAALCEREGLPAGHPCDTCHVQNEAVCRVLGTGDLMALRAMGSSQRLVAGQPLFHEGDPAGEVYNVTQGTLKLYKLLADGRRQVIGFIFPGDFLGITVEDDHACTAEALEDVQLCRFPRRRFDAFVDGSLAMERELYRLAAHELAAARAQMVLLGRKTAAERLASFFLSLAARRTGGGTGGARMVDLPMCRTDIADYLGLTKETVSRVLAHLKSQRLIRLDALDRIEILDRAGLAALAEGRDAV